MGGWGGVGWGLVDEFSARLFLQGEVRAGRLESYGVASEALALAEDDPLRIDWRQVMAAAADAAGGAGGHGALRVLQFPINVLEPRGAAVAADITAAAREGGRGGGGTVGLRVMGTRPLTTVLPLSISSEALGATSAGAAALLSEVPPRPNTRPRSTTPDSPPPLPSPMRTTTVKKAKLVCPRVLALTLTSAFAGPRHHHVAPAGVVHCGHRCAVPGFLGRGSTELPTHRGFPTNIKCFLLNHPPPSYAPSPPPPSSL